MQQRSEVWPFSLTLPRLAAPSEGTGPSYGDSSAPLQPKAFCGRNKEGFSNSEQYSFLPNNEFPLAFLHLPTNSDARPAGFAVMLRRCGRPTPPGHKVLPPPAPICLKAVGLRAGPSEPRRRGEHTSSPYCCCFAGINFDPTAAGHQGQ